MRTFLLRSVAGLAACALPAVVFAQEQAQDETEDDNTIIVLGEADRAAASVATRVPLSTMQTPFTIQQVSDAVIQESAARSLSDALRYIGTVGGTDNFGNAGEFFSSRGFQMANGSNYFRDGLRYRKYGQVPLYDIERIELLRGSASILYGALQPGGVLNIVSRTPQDDASTTLRLRAGSFDYYQATVDATGPLVDGVNYRIQGMYENAGSFRDVVESESGGVTGAFDVRLSPTTVLTARASWFTDERVGDRGTVMAYQTDGRFTAANGRKYDFADVPRSAFFGEKFGTNKFQDINLSLSLRQELGDKWQLRADVVHSDQEEDRVYIWAIPDNTPVDANGLLPRQIGDWNADLNGTLARLELAGEITTGPLTHKLVFGGEVERFNNTRTNERYQFSSINIYDPAYLDSRPANGTRTVNSPYGSLFQSTGVYIQNVIEIGQNWVVLGGLRYDHVTDDNTLNGARVRRQVAEAWTPQAGLVWRPTPFISPYLSYTRSFVPQSGTDFAGDPFDPERGEQFEGGIKLDIRPAKSIATIAVFQLDRDNLTMADPDHPGFNRLSGLQRSKGIEFSLDANPVDALRLTFNWNHLFSIKYVNDNSFAGNTVPNAPENALGLFATYDLADVLGGFSINAGATHVSRRQGINSNQFYLPAYTLVDLGARVKLNDNFQLMANVRNLFDATYYTGAINGTTVNVGAPRSFTVELRTGF
ncbi:TonB-dependent siderophore receptor [Altererythrobacter xixiisoli]|uniref:TonB-dependent siderophore receptor n=1 Tax=Croceibacterium xixiisoli TaxID=1476466 RepID=A0A6I4TP02_9SPHN|nr:TonB-dependent siderophore receptor [Croceibacterium xixiisoli]MXO97805.1 TonB-dependent siderophore receptor [Croceibacterium xixiisoli]